MEKTPKSLKYVRNVNDGNDSRKSIISSTPVKQAKKPRILENDVYSQANSDIDVAWDWDSPKNIKPKVSHRPKVELQDVPKLPTKKISQIDHLKNFEILRKLQALRNEIARVDDDDCLALDEQTFREESAKESDNMNSFIEEQFFHTENQETENLMKMDNNLPNSKNNAAVNDLLNDSYDEQLILCTQILEERLLQPNIRTVTCKESQKDILINKNQENCAIHFSNIESEVSACCTSSSKVPIERINMAIKALELEKPISIDTSLFKTSDDSFDAVLKDFQDEDIDTLTKIDNNNMKTFVPRKFETCSNLNTSFKRTFSDANVQYNPIKNESVKVSKFTLHRTHSFESAVTKEDELPKHIMQEIERKRMEALARLKAKKEKEKLQLKTTDQTYSNVSPMKCSPEEIEQKRLQAQAIRTAKQKEVIERNRLEAIKRLQINRLKRLGNKNTPKIK